MPCPPLLCNYGERHINIDGIGAIMSDTIKSIFSVKEPLSPEQEKKKSDEWQKENNPFIKKKSLDPKNGKKRMKLVLDNMNDPAEKHYFWFYNCFVRHEMTGIGKPAKGRVLKLKDVFDASVSSSFHGQVGSKISAMQQQVSSYLTQIGTLTKSIFPMVREIRLMDERLELYRNSFSSKQNAELERQNEIALKSTWIEVVEQGIQNPNSVYSMATKLGFVTLPDLFFGVNPRGKDAEEQLKNLTKELADIQKQQAFNAKVRTALEKKLVQYYTWKAKTYQEMSHTWKFRIKNLKQHYNVILLYNSWLKPYMTALKALQMKGAIDDPRLISAFESSKLELELLAETKVGKKYRGCVLVRFTITTRPDLTYTQSGQKQVSHAGRVEIEIEPYVATEEDINYYQKYTEKEVLKYYSGEEVDMAKSIHEIMDSLGTDVEEYLREAETGKRKEEKSENKELPKFDLFEPFEGLFDSVKIFLPDKEKKKAIEDTFELMAEKEDMEDDAKKSAWIYYDVFKKVNGLLATL